MTTPIGIPTTRVADLFILQRLLQQVQFDQAELLRLEMQLSSGRRFQLPSEDPVASLRIIDLQRLLERKEQVQSNLTTNQSYFSATDVAMSTISNLVAEVRGVALAAIGTIATDDQRSAAAQQVQQAINQLMDAGNHRFRGRYLFAGSNTLIRPFEMVEQGIKYLGNEQKLSSYGDIDLLFETNLTGSEVFGAISEPVRGSVDLDPILTYNTRLADLRGGLGISPGSIAISDGSDTSIIDISGAETIGDVAALIRANPPETRTIDVQITATGLVIQLNPAMGGDLSIREVGGGRAAYELGILTESPVGTSPVIGENLDPILRKTTLVTDILGTRPTAVVRSPGPDNDFILEADTCGPALNGVELRFIDDATVENEWVEFVPTAVPPRIDIHIEENQTQAQHVVSAINEAYDPVLLPFTARLDPLDEQDDGTGLVSVTATGQTAGGSGIEFDKDSGLQIVNGEDTYTISLTTAETIEDVLNILNGSGAGVLAEINDNASGINVRSRLSGADFAIGENGGFTATQLGLRTFTEDTALEDLNFGRGVDDYDGVDFVITRVDGVTLEVDIAGAHTIGDVLNRITSHPDNTPANPGGDPALTARLAAYGNGIELVDASIGSGDFTVTRAQLSTAAIDLGLIPEGEQSSSSSGPAPTLTGRDVGHLETEGIFTALLRLQRGLESNDMWQIQRAIEMLDRSVSDFNFSRAELGAKQQGLDVLEQRLDSEDVELREVLSLEYDVDMVEAVSNLAARQAVFEAALMSTARIFQMTLLNYL